jgi:SAM-dependent methyltransferase
MLKVVDYKKWVDYLCQIFKYYAKEVKLILDLACGSGIPSILLAQKGYKIIGVDSSPEMLKIFRSKIQNKNLDIILYEADMRNFQLPVKVDACVSFYDSINYLLSDEDLRQCFKSVAQALKSSGIFAFDVNTVFCLEHFWDNKETPRSTSEIYTIWKNTYDQYQRISTLELTVYTKKGDVFKEIHRERGYYPEEIEKALRDAGFNKIDFYEHSTFLPVTDVTLRMMVVAQKT